MPVYHGIKTIFVRVPKTASTSLCEKLYSADSYARYFTRGVSITETPKSPSELEKHESIRQIKESLPDTYFDDYYKVGFVRNPWDWLVSYYSYFQTYDISKKSVLVTGQYQRGRNRFKDISFHEFLLMVEESETSHNPEDKAGQTERPFQPQYNYLVDKDEKLIVDFIGRYENLIEDWRQICDHLNITRNRFRFMELQHYNNSIRDSYRTYYNDEDVKRVHSIYREDIELFGYLF